MSDPVSVECVLDAGAALGECPVWDGRGKWLFWIDIDSGRSTDSTLPGANPDLRRLRLRSR